MLRSTTPKEKKPKKKRQRKVKSKQSSLSTAQTAEMKEKQQYYEGLLNQLQVELQNVEQGDPALTAIHLQRYGGQRLSPDWYWVHPELAEYLEFTHMETYPPELSDTCPKAKDYDWGNHWNGYSEDVKRFVIDRAKWRQPQMKIEIKKVEKTLEFLRGRLW